MRATKLTALAASLLIGSAIFPQNNEDNSHNDRVFKRFRVAVAGTGMRFIGKKEQEVKRSKTGKGFFIEPAWNITDHHSLGLKMVGGFHAEKNGTDHFSVLANYQYTYYGEPNNIPDRFERLITLFAGTGADVTNGPTHNADSIFGKYPGKTSFAMMPYVGIRYGFFFADGHFHWAAGNKQNTFAGFSVGIVFGGGLVHHLSRISTHRS